MTECDTYAINWQAFGKAVVFENIQFTEDGIFLFLIRLYFSKSLKCELPVWTCLFLLGFFHHFLTLPPLSQFLSRRPELDHNRLNTLIVYFNLPNGNPFLYPFVQEIFIECLPLCRDWRRCKGKTEPKSPWMLFSWSLHCSKGNARVSSHTQYSVACATF